MQGIKLSDAEKKEILREILGENHSAVGVNFPVFSKFMDNLTKVNNALKFADLIPCLGSFLSGTVASTVISAASVVGILMFPVVQLANLINANQTGHRMYYCRAVAYATTAWAFDKPVPTGSARIMSNKFGRSKTRQAEITEHKNLWMTTANSVFKKLDDMAVEKKISKQNLKTIFRALAENRTDVLCVGILKEFEGDFMTTARNVWKSNYKITYPQ
jgi:hypothetical protein